MKKFTDFVRENFYRCSVSFLAAYHRWTCNLEMYAEALTRAKNGVSREDWLTLERAVAVIFFHQGFVNYKCVHKDRYFQLSLCRKEPTPPEGWQYLRRKW